MPSGFGAEGCVAFAPLVVLALVSVVVHLGGMSTEWNEGCEFEYTVKGCCDKRERVGRETQSSSFRVPGSMPGGMRMPLQLVRSTAMPPYVPLSSISQSEGGDS